MIYVGCPANLFTGGPELTHQLCKAINENGYESKMCYYNGKRQVVHMNYDGTKYESYRTTAATTIDEVNQKNNYLIVPETAIYLGYQCDKCHVIIYWMSVDNYFVGLNSEDDKKYREYFKKKEIIHLVQSQYAYEFCKMKLDIEESNILFVSDYIGREYKKVKIKENSKKDYICYNPKKGFDIISNLIYKYPEYCWIPLYNLSTQEMIERLSISKIYIDFGHHPGKDRIPREATMCGCCIITNRKGAAANTIDIPIPQEYKFEDEKNFEKVISKIDYLFENYQTAQKDFEYYIEKIKEEKEVFTKQVQEFLQYINR